MIDIGRTKQLFFDDYLVESLANAKPGMNQALKADDNPVLRPERHWEGNHMRPLKVVFDPEDQVFRMWYSASTISVRLENGKPVRGGAAGFELDSRGHVTCLALSRDGVCWERPSLGLVEFEGSKDNNILPEKGDLPTHPDFRDQHETDPEKLYKAMRLTGGTQTRGMQYDLFHSPDGIDWTAYEWQPRHRHGTGAGALVGPLPGLGPHPRDLLRHHGGQSPLARPLRQAPDRQGGKPGHDPLERAGDHPGAGPGRLSRHRVLQHAGHSPTKGVYVGLLWIFRTTDVTHHPELVFSRNGFHFQRNYREPFIPRGAALGDFDSSSVYAQDVIVHGDRILTYYIGTNSRSPEVALRAGGQGGDRHRPGGLAARRVRLPGQRQGLDRQGSVRGGAGKDHRRAGALLGA